MLTVDLIWGVAAAMFLSGPLMRRFARRSTAAGDRRCGECGYDLVGTTNTSDRCPECGATLADAAIDTRLDESGVRRRRRVRRVGGWCTVAGLAALSILLLIDLRRIPVTPPAWLARVDARWAVRSPDTTSAAVFQRLVDLRCGGELTDADLRTAADQILTRIDQPNHGGAPARELIMHAWRDGVVADEELASIDGLWPVIELEPTSGTRSSMTIRTRVDCGDFRVPIAKAGLGIEIAWNEILVDGVSFATGRRQEFSRWPGPGLAPRNLGTLDEPTPAAPVGRSGGIDADTVPAEVRMTVSLVDERRGTPGVVLAAREVVVARRLEIEDPAESSE